MKRNEPIPVYFSIGFPGQYYDTETGLHYNYYRTYHPSIGRYLTPDPLGLEGGLNLFAYVGNNPVMRVDLTGLKSGSPCQKENRCDQSWPECYTNCINALVPFDAFKTFVYSNMIANVGFYLSGGVTSITIYGTTIVVYESPMVLTGLAGAAAGIVGEAGLWASAGVAGWVAGSSYGCMISCAIDKCNY